MQVEIFIVVVFPLKGLYVAKAKVENKIRLSQKQGLSNAVNLPIEVGDLIEEGIYIW